MKLHVGFDQSDYLPELNCVADSRAHNVVVGRIMRFLMGSIVAIDQVFTDYS